MRRRAALGVILACATAAYGAILVRTQADATVVPSAGSPTDVVRWSPFDSAGNLKRTLRVDETRRGRCTDIGYTYVGGIGYRCGSGNGLYNGCFREGPNATENVICVGVPWDTGVTRLRSPHLLLYPGVTFTAAADHPWAIVLKDGNRCRVTQGAHDALTAHGRRYTVDYGCEKDRVVLLREGIKRGRTWQVNAARWTTKGYTFLGHQPVRRVYFGALPPPMARQNRLANQAYREAAKIVKRKVPSAQLGLVWVRLALPQADWAYVIFTPADASRRGWFTLLRRTRGTWVDASARKPYCTNLPRRVSQQLFLARNVRVPDLLAPQGETRC